MPAETIVVPDFELTKLPHSQDDAQPEKLAANLKKYQAHLLRSTWNAPMFDVNWGTPAAAAGAVTVEAPGPVDISAPTANPHLAIADARTSATPIPQSITIKERGTNSLGTPAKNAAGEPGSFTPSTDLKTDYKIRMLQFARAAILTLNLQNDPTLAAKAHSIYEDTRAFLDLIDSLPKAELKSKANVFFMHLAHIVSGTDKPYNQSTGKLLIQAEQILTWEDGRVQQSNTTHLKVGEKTYEITRTEETLANLTNAQKQEYLNIRNVDSPPTWYEALPSLLKSYLLKTVPDPHQDSEGHVRNFTDEQMIAADEWGKIQHTIPATLRGVPGLANFTRSRTTIRDITAGEPGEVITESFMYRSATPPPIDLMRSGSSKERVRLARLNIEQYLDQRLADNKANGSDSKDFPINTLLNELVGEDLLYKTNLDLSLGHKDSNTRFIAEIKEAIRQIKADAKQNPDRKYKDLNIFETSTPVNNFRYLSITKNSDNSADDKKYLDYCTKRIESLNEKPSLSDDEQAEKKLLEEASKALKNLQGRVDYFGDTNLLRAALYEIIIPGGLSGCKSGKDRQVYKQDTAAALMAYYATHDKTFPDFKLPEKLPRPVRSLGHLGITVAAIATVLLLLAGTLFPPLGITILIAVAATAAAVSLGIGAYAFFKANPNFEVRREFIGLMRHMRLSGFGSLSASLNAPGVYGQKNPDIAPDDLTQLEQSTFPFRKNQLLIDLPLYIIGTGALATATYFLAAFVLSLTAAALAPAILTILPIVLVLAVAVPLISYAVTKFARYYSTPRLSNAEEMNARIALKETVEQGVELADGNKYKYKAKAKSVEKLAELEIKLKTDRDSSAMDAAAKQPGISTASIAHSSDSTELSSPPSPYDIMTVLGAKDEEGGEDAAGPPLEKK